MYSMDFILYFDDNMSAQDIVIQRLQNTDQYRLSHPDAWSNYDENENVVLRKAPLSFAIKLFIVYVMVAIGRYFDFF
jgi:hypothetical protein